MAARCLLAAAVALLAHAGTSLAAVNQNQLATIVTEILNWYRPSYKIHGDERSYPMFSLAVSVPYNRDKNIYDISRVSDTGHQVREEVLKCNVYTSARMVAATVLRWPNVVRQCPHERVQWRHVLSRCPSGVVTWADVHRRCPGAVGEGAGDHAEYRIVQHFHTLLNKRNRDDLLIFYVLASPCNKRCASKTNPKSILEGINQILRWNNYAVVFSDVFKPRSGVVIPEDELRDALVQLGAHRGRLGAVGLHNIYRCNHKSAGSSDVKCTSCSTGDRVAHYCFSDELASGQSQRFPSSSLTHTQKQERDRAGEEMKP